MQVSLIGVHNVDTIWPHLREGFQRAVMKTGGDIETGDLWVQCRNGSAFLLVATGPDNLRQEATDVDTPEATGDNPRQDATGSDSIRIYGASIWTRQTWQTGRKLRCLALYGTGMTGWIHEMKALAERLAKDNGCTSLVSDGRVGWKRIFPNAKVLRNLYEEKL